MDLSFNTLHLQLQAFVDMGGRDKALRVLAVVTMWTPADSGAADAIYRHLSSNLALAAKLFVGCANLSGRILSCLFERICQAASYSKDFLVGLASSVTEAAHPAVLSTLLRKVGSAQLACR